MNKKFIGLVNCPEIEDRYCPDDDNPHSYGLEEVCYPSLEWLKNECRELLNQDETRWWVVNDIFADWLMNKYDNPNAPDEKTAWAEYLLHLIKENKK